MSAQRHANDDEIARRAYELWQERGCPIGSPDVDWLQAEEELRNEEQFISEGSPSGTLESETTAQGKAVRRVKPRSEE